MKKFLSLFIILTMCISLFVGCAKKKEDTSVSYDTFMKNLNILTSQSPKLTVTPFNELALEDDTTAHTYHITEPTSEDKLRLSINTNEKNKIISVTLSAEKDYYCRAPFLLVSLHVYKAMGFSNTDKFFEEFNLLSEEQIYEKKTINDYEIVCMTIDATDEIILYISLLD